VLIFGSKGTTSGVNARQCPLLGFLVCGWLRLFGASEGNLRNAFPGRAPSGVSSRRGWLPIFGRNKEQERVPGRARSSRVSSWC